MYSKVWTVLLFVAVFSGIARAELAGDAAQFIADYDRLIAQRDVIQADRDAMALHLDDNGQLRKDVKKFFADRAEAYALKLLKAADRKQLRITLDFSGPKVAKPTKGTGNLQLDATSYINNYDAWKAQQELVQLNIEQMRAAIGASDNAALTTAATDFFTNSRLRLEKRLQWQSDVRAMKKDVGFKGTGKAAPPPGDNLRDHVAEFLADRAAWEALEAQLDADRNNLRAAVTGGGSLEPVVNTFLTDRRARHVKGVELALDRKVMRKDVGLSAGAKETKSGTEVKSKDLDSDEELGSLEETSDGAGEK